jgi:hypothetical protein
LGQLDRKTRGKKVKTRPVAILGLILTIVLLMPRRAQLGSLVDDASLPTDPVYPLLPTADSQNVALVNHIGGNALTVAIQGDYAYVGEGYSLTIVDVSNPVSPTRMGQTFPLARIPRAVDVVGDYAYVADGSGMRVLDVSDPIDPAEVGFYDTPGTAYGLAVAGDYAYVADGGYGYL